MVYLEIIWRVAYTGQNLGYALGISVYIKVLAMVNLMILDSRNKPKFKKNTIPSL